MVFTRSKPSRGPLFEKHALELNESELARLGGIENQYRLTDALLGFTDAMGIAFEHLGKAREALQSNGLGGSVEAAALNELLFSTFGGAHTASRNLAAAIRPQLEVSRSTAVACTKDLHEAERTASKVKKYRKELQALKSKKAKEWRVQKVQEKLEPAEHLANVAVTRALDSLRGCSLREGDLCHLIGELMQGTMDAIQLSVEPLRSLTTATDSAVDTSETWPVSADSFNHAPTFNSVDVAGSPRRFPTICGDVGAEASSEATSRYPTKGFDRTATSEAWSEATIRHPTTRPDGSVNDVETSSVASFPISAEPTVTLNKIDASPSALSIKEASNAALIINPVA